MKSKLLFSFLILLICFVITGCEPKVTDDPNAKKTKYDVYILSGDMDDEKVTECMRYIKSVNPTKEFCRGNEKILIGSEEYTFKEAIDNDVFTKKQLDYLASHEILVYYYIPPVIYEILEWIYPLFKTVRL